MMNILAAPRPAQRHDSGFVASVRRELKLAGVVALEGRLPGLAPPLKLAERLTLLPTGSMRIL
jgi:hypothetical protein